MLGRLLELSLVVRDTGLAWQRWLDMGFAAAETGDVWPHRYGVVTSGGLAIGLHAAGDEPSCVTFVRPEVAALERMLADRLIGIERARLDPDSFNYLELREPGGMLLRVQEARTFSAPPEDAESTALGRWKTLSLPSTDLAEARGFWERLDYEVQDGGQPWDSIAIQGLPLACHDAALANAPVLLFATGRRAVADRKPHGLLRTPEGIQLLQLD